MKRLAIASALVLPLLAAGPVAAQTYNLTLSGASPGGLWSRIGRGVDAALAAAYPGSTITYQTGSGGFANIALVSAGKVPMGIAVDMELVMAKNGQKPFHSKITNVRQLVRVYSPSARFQAQHVLIRKSVADKYGLKSVADIAKKKAPLRIAINRRGNSDSDIARLLLEQSGVSLADIKKWGGQVVYAASREATSLMLDRRIDVVAFGIAYNHPRVREMERGVDLAMLQVDPAVAAKVAKMIGGQTCKFKASEYKFIHRDINSVCAGASIVVNADMDEKTAYNLTKAIVTHIAQFKTAHRLIAKNTTPATFAEPSPVPFHPGAAKYFKEAGLLK
jgi:TRAP transporter TAXI family solute receptor